MTKASTKKGMAGKLLAAGCSLALAASLTPAAALTALAAVPADTVIDVTVDYKTSITPKLVDSDIDLTDQKIKKASGNVSALYFVPDTSVNDKKGTWGVITSYKSSFVTISDILAAAKNTATGYTAADYWKAGATITVTGTITKADGTTTNTTWTATYDQFQAATNYYPNTGTSTTNTSGAVTIEPGIAMEAYCNGIQQNATADGAAENNIAAINAGETTSKTTMSLMPGLSETDYLNANLAQGIDDVESIAITLPDPTYPDVPRIAGEEWADTMNDIVAASGFSNETAFVVAGSNNYQDALCASGFAGALGCPLLMTDKDELTPQTAAQISRLVANGGAKVYVIGGPLAVSESVANAINQLDGIRGKLENPVVRIGGETAADTSRMMYEKMQTGTGSADLTKAIVTTSIAFQDALSISPYAYQAKIPVVLTNDSNVLDDATVADLEKQAAAAPLTEVLVLGGPLAVSYSVDYQLGDIDNVSGISRIGKANAYETSNAIAEHLASNVGVFAPATTKAATVATGENYLDALAASQYCGKKALTLLLVSGSNTYTVDNFIKDTADVEKVTIFGGPLAVSNSTQAQINKIVAPRS